MYYVHTLLAQLWEEISRPNFVVKAKCHKDFKLDSLAENDSMPQKSLKQSTICICNICNKFGDKSKRSSSLMIWPIVTLEILMLFVPRIHKCFVSPIILQRFKR